MAKLLRPSIELLDDKRAEAIGVAWNPVFHFAVRLWQIGFGKKRFFGFIETFVPDVEKIARIVTSVGTPGLGVDGGFAILCGSYWNLRSEIAGLGSGQLKVIARDTDALGGERLALRGAKLEDLAKAIEALWARPTQKPNPPA